MSFDPHNPRGAPRPTAPQSSIPPQPINQRTPPSRNVLLAAGIVIGLIVLGIPLVLVNLTGKPAASPAPSSHPGSSGAPATAGGPHASSVPATNLASLSIPTFVPSVGPPPSAGSAGAALLGHIPDSIRGSCVLGESSDQDIVASARCALDTGILATYAQYANLDSMNAAYQQQFAQAQIDANSGSCEDPNSWPAESAYDVQGASVGRRLCTNAPGTPTINWTDERLNILSTAAGSDAAGLIAFWTNEAGPIQ